MIEAFKWFQLVTAFIAFRFVWCAPRSLATTEAFGFHQVVYLTAFWMRSHHFTHWKPGQDIISSPNPIVHSTSCLYVHYSFRFTSNRFNKQTFLPSSHWSTESFGQFKMRYWTVQPNTGLLDAGTRSIGLFGRWILFQQLQAYFVLFT